MKERASLPRLRQGYVGQAGRARPLQPRRRGGMAPVWIHGREAGIHIFSFFFGPLLRGASAPTIAAPYI
jgi:hypothetical protein